MGKKKRRDEKLAEQRDGRGQGAPSGPRRTRALGVLGVVLGLGAASFWLWPRAVRRDPGLSVLLISVDTLRADALGAYGRKNAETPWLDRLAKDGARFERAHASNVVTLPSHANILSGRLPTAHGIRDNSGFRFPKDQDTLATLLKRRGFETAAFVSGFPLDSRFGLDRGFDVYDDRFGEGQSRTAFVMPQRRGLDTVAQAVRWLEAHRGRQTFCFVHLYDPHFPYDPPEPWRSRFRAEPYQGEVAAADAALGSLLKPLLDAGSRARTLVVMTGDHGESLGEHGELTHGIFAYEATLRVPLVVWAPGLVRPAVLDPPVRHVDILPTVLDLLGQPAPADANGTSLVPVLSGHGTASPALYFESLSSSLNQGWAPLRGVMRGSLKYVDLPLPELYDVARDPAEARNLVADRPQDLEELQGLLRQMRAEDRGIRRGKEEAATREHLRALGYVAAASTITKERYTEEDDPKRLIEVDTANREVIRLYQAGESARALALCRENVKKRPTMPLPFLHLAFLERERGDLKAAVDAARRAFELNPLDAEAISLFANYLTESGNPGEAVTVLTPYARREEPDVDVLTSLGVALTALSRPAEALEALERARKADPTNAMVYVNIGTVHLVTGDRRRAREAFEGALDLDPRMARAENSLGVIAAQEKRLGEAVERWKRAVELDPTNHQTLYNLGTLLWSQGRQDEARPYLEAYVRRAPRALEARDIQRVINLLNTAH